MMSLTSIKSSEAERFRLCELADRELVFNGSSRKMHLLHVHVRVPIFMALRSPSQPTIDEMIALAPENHHDPPFDDYERWICCRRALAGFRIDINISTNDEASHMETAV